MSAAQPRVVLVGGATTVAAGLAEALARRAVSAVTTALAELGEAVPTAAPDLIVALDEAARDTGMTVLGELGRSPHTAAVPVAMVKDDPELAARLGAFRLGVCAVIKRQASVDALAEEIARVLRDLQ